MEPSIAPRKSLSGRERVHCKSPKSCHQGLENIWSLNDIMVVSYKREEKLDRPASQCSICGVPNRLDQHHIRHRGMGGSKDPAVSAEENLITLCRRCHQNIHEGGWQL